MHLTKQRRQKQKKTEQKPPNSIYFDVKVSRACPEGVFYLEWACVSVAMHKREFCVFYTLSAG